jgi:hypothetical protein
MIEEQKYKKRLAPETSNSNTDGLYVLVDVLKMLTWGNQKP